MEWCLVSRRKSQLWEVYLITVSLTEAASLHTFKYLSESHFCVKGILLPYLVPYFIESIVNIFRYLNTMLNKWVRLVVVSKR